MTTFKNNYDALESVIFEEGRIFCQSSLQVRKLLRNRSTLYLIS